VEGRLLDV